MKPGYAWCVVKSVAVRMTEEPDSKIIDRITFGQGVSVLENVSGRIRILYYKSNVTKKLHLVGWVTAKALTRCEYQDYSSLWFSNETGRRIQVVDSYYNGKCIGYIEPNERVAVAARVGSLYLTNRGWTRVIWLEKCRDIFDQSVIDHLLLYVLSWAVKDYKATIKQIKEHKYHSPREFCNLVDDLNDTGVFFCRRGNALNCDKLPGIDRIKSLNEDMGVDMEWLKKQLDKAEEYRGRMKKR